MRNVTRKSRNVLLVIVAVGLIWCLRGVRIGNPATFSNVLPRNDRSAYSLTQSSQLNDALYVERLQAFFERGTKGSFKGKGGVDIKYRMFVQPSDEKGAIVISSGRTEALTMYKELIYDLYNQKYSVYIHDHRGQGQSGRLVADRERSHVDNFDDYIDDLHQFVRDYVQKTKHAHLFLLAHSMGGGIATRYVETYSDGVTAMALVTPMHAPLAPVSKVALGTTLCAGSRLPLAASILTAEDYAFNQGPWKTTTFEENDLTHSAQRFAIKTKEQAPWRIGGVTHGWFREACRATDLSREDAAKGRVKIPVLILQAGGDTAVSNRAQKDFCDKVNEAAKGRCEGYVLPDSYHAVFIEEDAIRTPAVAKILDFFAAHA